MWLCDLLICMCVCVVDVFVWMWVSAERVFDEVR